MRPTGADRRQVSFEAAVQTDSTLFGALGFVLAPTLLPAGRFELAC